MNEAIAGLIVAVIVGITGLILDRRDKRKAKDAEVFQIPDNRRDVKRLNKRLRVIDAENGIQSERVVTDAAGRNLAKKRSLFQRRKMDADGENLDSAGHGHHGG